MAGGVAGFGAGGYAGPIRILSFPSEPRAAAFRSESTNRVFVSWFQPQFTGAINPAAEITRYKVEFARDVNFTTFDPADTLFATGTQRSSISQVYSSHDSAPTSHPPAFASKFRHEKKHAFLGDLIDE